MMGLKVSTSGPQTGENWGRFRDVEKSVDEKRQNMCVSEGLMHVAAWYRRTRTKVTVQTRGISVEWPDA